MTAARYPALGPGPFIDTAGAPPAAVEAAAPICQSVGAAADLVESCIHEIFAGYSKMHEDFPRGFCPVAFYNDIIEMPLILRRSA